MGRLIEKNSRLAKANNFEEHEPIYMYHVSPKPLHGADNSIVMEPKHIWNGEDDLFHIKRICVAPTIEQCLVAIAPTDFNKFYVYRTLTVVKKSVMSYGVFDSALTQERWLTRTRKFKLVAEIHIGDTDIETEILSREWEENKPYPNYILMDFSSRGGMHDLKRQHRELNKTRRFLKQHDKNMFLNDIEKQLHDKQRNMKLRMNRYDITRLYSSGTS